MCANDCSIDIGGKGFCGLVLNVDGRLVRLGGTSEKGVLQWYYDQLPTNCVAWWFCPGCTGAGYPRYAYKRQAETNHSNLAVFYGACSLDCLFCQNWHYRNLAEKLQPIMSAESLADKADRHVSCICYFGGDPSVQMPHAIKTSELAIERAIKEKRILRICWETNGYWKAEFALEAAELSLRSGAEVIISPLTPREREILNYIAQGYLNKQIAVELGISEQTIKNHVTSILRKLNANVRTEAVVLAIRQGLISIS